MAEYLEFDEYGLKEVRCMRCLTQPIMKRSYIEMPDKIDKGKMVQVMCMEKLASFNQPVQVEIEIDGNKSYYEPMVCSACKTKDLTTDDMVENLVDGWGLEMRKVNKRPKDMIDDWKTDKKKKVKKTGKKKKNKKEKK